MSFGIIIRGKNKPPQREAQPSGQKFYFKRTPSQAARHAITRQNRQEYDNEKRALELEAKMPCGHPDAKAVAIAKMMNMPEAHVKKIIKNKKKSKVVLDGKID